MSPSRSVVWTKIVPIPSLRRDVPRVNGGKPYRSPASARVGGRFVRVWILPPRDYSAAEMTVWIVKYDGPCSKCGTWLRAGTEAVWDLRARRMSCLDCSLQTPPPPERPSVDAGIAGRSARIEHQRRVATREAKLKAQWGDRLGGWVTKLTDEPLSTRAWAMGAVGWERLGGILDGIEGVAVLHDRRIPARQSNIDHIVFAPAGIFVVDTKHYAGQVQVRRRGSFFRPEDRLHVGRWDRTDDVNGVKAQVAVVESVLSSSDVEPKPPVTPVLCFTRAEWPLFGGANSLAGVYLESARSLKKLLTASADFSTEELDRARRAIALGLPTNSLWPKFSR